MEPVDPGSFSTNSNATAQKSAQAVFQAFTLKWKNDALENAARSYCTARQELNMLSELRHSHVTSLLGFSLRYTLRLNGINF